MSSECLKISCDSVDPLDAVVLYLDKVFDQGLDAGKAFKIQKLIEEGLSAGWSKGISLGKEIGTYLGILDRLKTESLSEQDAAKVLRLQSLILELQPLNFDQHAKLLKVRSSFKQLAKALHLPIELKESQKHSF